MSGNGRRILLHVLGGQNALRRVGRYQGSGVGEWRLCAAAYPNCNRTVFRPETGVYRRSTAAPTWQSPTDGLTQLPKTTHLDPSFTRATCGHAARTSSRPRPEPTRTRRPSMCLREGICWAGGGSGSDASDPRNRQPVALERHPPGASQASPDRGAGKKYGNATNWPADTPTNLPDVES